MCSVYVAFGAVRFAIENPGEQLQVVSAVGFAWLLPGVKVYSSISVLRVCSHYDPLRVLASALKRICSHKNVFSKYLSKAVWCSKSVGVKNMQVKYFAESQTLFSRAIVLTGLSHWLELFIWVSRGLGIGRGHGAAHGATYPRDHGQRPCSSRTSVLSPKKEVGGKCLLISDFPVEGVARYSKHLMNGFAVKRSHVLILNTVSWQNSPRTCKSPCWCLQKAGPVTWRGEGPLHPSSSNSLPTPCWSRGWVLATEASLWATPGLF